MITNSLLSFQWVVAERNSNDWKSLVCNLVELLHEAFYNWQHIADLLFGFNMVSPIQTFISIDTSRDVEDHNPNYARKREPQKISLLIYESFMKWKQGNIRIFRVRNKLDDLNIILLSFDNGYWVDSFFTIFINTYHKRNTCKYKNHAFYWLS